MKRILVTLLVVATMCIFYLGLQRKRSHQSWGNSSANTNPSQAAQVNSADSYAKEDNGDEQVGQEGWRITKKVVPHEDLPNLVLPQPDANAETTSTEQSQLVAQGLRAWRTGSIKEAMNSFEKALQENSEDVGARSNFGRLLTMMNAKGKALTHLERAAELAPEDPQVWLDLATLYERATQLERAFYAKAKAKKLAGEQTIYRDKRGFWMIDGKSFP